MEKPEEVVVSYLRKTRTGQVICIVLFFIFVSIVIKLNGGAPSVYAYLFFMPILAVAFVYGWAWALLTTTAASFVATFLLSPTGISFTPSLLDDFLVRFAIMGLVGVEAGIMAQRLRRETKERETSYASLQAKLQEMASLRTIDRAIVQDVDVYSLFPEIIKLVSESLSADVGIICITNGKGFQVAASYGVPEEIRQEMEGFTLCEEDNRFWTQSRLITCRRLDDNAFCNWPTFERLKESLHLSCGCAVPLKVGSHHFGSLSLFFHSPDVLDKGVAEEAEIFAGQVAVAVRNNQLLEEMSSLTFDLVQTLAGVVDLRDAYTGGHSERVTKYALGIGEELGLSPEELRVLRYSAVLHDLGKVAISERILHKPTALTTEEWVVMKKHPKLAAQILGKVKFFKDILPAVYHHHEKFDGNGYPDNLRNGKIPLTARILSLADAFEAMTSDRPYRKALSPEEALAEINRESGRQFDPRVVEAFLRYLGKKGNIQKEE
ncbi:MAG: HD domain-containing phosphohydrolase [Candidatus Omnitrophota bacterium]